MIYFTQASPVLRVYAILLLFAAIILELFLLILTAHRTGRRYQFTANCMLFAAASILMCGLTAAHGHHGPSEILCVWQNRNQPVRKLRIQPVGKE